MNIKIKMLSLVLLGLLLCSCGNSDEPVKNATATNSTAVSIFDLEKGSNTISLPKEEIVENSNTPPLSLVDIPGAANKVDLSNVDIDLTTYSSTMIYSEVLNMVNDPKSNEGKVCKMNGICSRLEDTEKGIIYYTCVVKDATACCASGIEFILADTDISDYPSFGDEITVTGILSSYKEGTNTYQVLINAVLDGSK